MTVVRAGRVESQIIRDNLWSDAEFQRQFLGQLSALDDVVRRVQGNLRILEELFEGSDNGLDQLGAEGRDVNGGGSLDGGQQLALWLGGGVHALVRGNVNLLVLLIVLMDWRALKIIKQ